MFDPYPTLCMSDGPSESEDAAPPSPGVEEEDVQPEKVLSERELTEYERKERRKGIVSGSRRFGFVAVEMRPRHPFCGVDTFAKDSSLHEASEDPAATVRVWKAGSNLPEA